MAPHPRPGAVATGAIPNRAAGFSLVEVLCAILILGVALVGLTQGITTALRSTKESELQTTAALLASARVEQLRTDGYLSAGVTEGECTDLPLYQWRQTLALTELEGLYDVEVVIAHTKSGQEIYSLRTMVFEAPVSAALEETKAGRDAGRNRRREASR